MPAASRQPVDLGLAGLRMTADEYLAHGETPERYELIDGVVVMSPSPVPIHQLLKQEVAFQIMQFSRGTGAAVVFQDTDVRFGPHLVYCPDVAVYLAARLPTTPRRLASPPDLIVEVLSPGNRPLDLVTKRGDYERFGVGEYWVIDPDEIAHAGGIRAWQRRDGAFIERAPGSDPLPSAALPGFSLDLGALRRLVPKPDAR